MKAIVVQTILFAALFGFFGCGNQKNEVVVYTTVDQVFSEPILKDFERETGIKVKAVFDTEETKSTGVLNRLIAEKDKGMVTIANPLFGTTSFHFAAIFLAKGNREAKQFFTGLRKNGIIVATSNGDVRKRVVQGEVPCGITDTDDANEALKAGAPVKFVFLDQQAGGFGSLIIPNTLSLLKDSPNNVTGKKLIDYLLSRKTEEKLAASCVQMPLHKGVKLPERVPSLDKILPMKINYDKAAEKLEEILPYLKEWQNQ